MEAQLHPSMNREDVSPLSIPQNPLMQCRKERKKKLVCSMKREYYIQVLVIFCLILTCQPAVVIFYIILTCQPAVVIFCIILTCQPAVVIFYIILICQPVVVIFCLILICQPAVVIFCLILICQPAVVIFCIILFCQSLLCFASLLSPELFDYGYFELQGLGKLAEKFPNIASTSVYCLRDFLVTPSRILLTLRQQCGYADRDVMQRLKITGMVLFLQR